MCDTVTPQGVVAVVDMPASSLDDLMASGDLILVLADVRDPGNAGTLLRSAVAAGGSGVIFGSGSVDPFHPKTVRAAAGALFSLPIVRGVEVGPTLDALAGAGFAVLAADMDAKAPHDRIDLTGRVAFVLGNEAWGLPGELAGHVGDWVSIAMPGPAESLNVGIAGSILLFETVRQRGVNG